MRSALSAIITVIREFHDFSMMYLVLLALCVDLISPYRFLDVGARRNIMVLSNDEMRKRIPLKRMKR